MKSRKVLKELTKIGPLSGNLLRSGGVIFGLSLLTLLGSQSVVSRSSHSFLSPASNSSYGLEDKGGTTEGGDGSQPRIEGYGGRPT